MTQNQSHLKYRKQVTFADNYRQFSDKRWKVKSLPIDHGRSNISLKTSIGSDPIILSFRIHRDGKIRGNGCSYFASGGALKISLNWCAMFPVGIKIEFQGRFTTNTNRNTPLLTSRNGINWLSKSRSGGNNFGQFSGGEIYNINICVASAATKTQNADPQQDENIGTCNH